VGYRWYDSKEVPVQFPFGHGLSYTEFEYSNAKASKTDMTADGTIKVSVDIRNTGDVDGAEVVQLYIADPIASIDRPSKELKGFEKVWLKAGEKKTVTFEIDSDDLSFYDVTKGGWNAEAGEFLALIARSAGDVRETVMFNLK
jgi:beta-glucosidase